MDDNIKSQLNQYITEEIIKRPNYHIEAGEVSHFQRIDRFLSPRRSGFIY